MPKRTNLFQEVVAIVHRHMAGDAEVEESALLPHSITGDLREVDVVIRSQVGGYEVVVGIEATAAGRAADVGWVEQLVKKHEGLPTHKLILVAQEGFTDQARALAEHHLAVALSPQNLDSEQDRDAAVIRRLPTLWPKLIALTPETVLVHLEDPNGNELKFRAATDHLVFLDDGTQLGTIHEALMTNIRAQMETIADQIGLADIAESMDRYFKLHMAPWKVRHDGVERHLCVRFDEAQPPELHPITELEVIGKARIEVQEVQFQHMKLGDVEYGFGQGQLSGREALFVITGASETGALTVRLGADADEGE